ncbi:MAG: VCBS repeat-containing protein [Paracoccaceae bacterium]
MPVGAPRLPLRSLHCAMRGAGLTLWFLLASLGGLVTPTSGHTAERGCVGGDDPRIARVCFVDEPDSPVYGHAVLGDTPEWDVLEVHWAPGSAPEGTASVTRVNRKNHVFEDIAPRLVEVDGQPGLEIVVVRSSFSKGAQLVVYGVRDGELKILAETPYIGTRNRWLAPAAISDLDGDGHVELAFVDRPHLARTLRVWRFQNDSLKPVASMSGVTNHRIGEPFITGGVRICADGPEIITADARWSQIVATQLKNDTLVARALGAYSPAKIKAALACAD